MLEHIEIETGANPDHSILWFHGLGASGHDFADIVPHLKLPADFSARFIFPHAPIQPVSLNGGMTMPSWFDIPELSLTAQYNHADIENAENLIMPLIEREFSRGISANKLFLCGFSQGGAVALFAGLRFPQKLAGIIGLSTFLAIPTTDDPGNFHDANQTTPILLAHGRQDMLLPCAWGESTKQRLLEKNYDVAWSTYDMPHEVCAEELALIGQFLSQ